MNEGLFYYNDLVIIQFDDIVNDTQKNKAILYTLVFAENIHLLIPFIPVYPFIHVSRLTIIHVSV